MTPFRPTPPPLDAQLGKKHPLRILLAEDNIINQKVALQLLARMGYQADLAIDGLQVLETLHRQQYDLVLMDMQMPEMDGITTTRCICQEWSKAERPRIIAMTANTMQDNREQCLEAGMDDYISKPIRIEALLQALLDTPSSLSTQHTLPEREAQTTLSTQESTQHGLSPATRGALSTPKDTPLDIQILASFRDMVGTKADVVLAEMIDCYLEEAPQLLNAIASAIAQEDAIILRRVTHTLKSSSITLGATKLSHFCQELEVIGGSGNTEQGVDKLPQLQAEYERVKTALQRERQQLNL